jgi:hypothetical protein
MLTAVLVKIDEESSIAEKTIFVISQLEALKGGTGKSEGQNMNEEKTGGGQPNGVAFGWSYRV